MTNQIDTFGEDPYDERDDAVPVPDYCRVVLSDDPKYMTVWFHWRMSGGYSTLSRPCAEGISCLPRHVPRLVRAFLEGALHDGPLRNRAAGPQVGVDINGHSYPDATSKVYGKTLNRDLTRLGY